MYLLSNIAISGIYVKFQDCYIFRLGKPNLKLYLPLFGGRSKVSENLPFQFRCITGHPASFFEDGEQICTFGLTTVEVGNKNHRKVLCSVGVPSEKTGEMIYIYIYMCDRVDQLPLFPYNRGWEKSTQ